MFNSVKMKISVPVITVLVLLVLFLIWYVSNSVRGFADQRSGERLQGSSQSVLYHLGQLERYSRMTARAIAGSEDIVDLVNKWNNGACQIYAREALLEYLCEANAELGLANSVLIDINGVVILRTHEVDNYGDDGLFSPTLAAAMEGTVSTVYSSIMPFMPMGLSSAAPIVHNGEIIGAIAAIIELGDQDFVDSFGHAFNAEVTIFAGYTAVATTIYRDDGTRAVGNTANDYVVNYVLEQGLTHDMEIRLFGEMYHGYYFPLIGWDGETTGIFFVGFSIESSIQDMISLEQNLLLISFVGVAIAGFVMLNRINSNLTPIGHLSKIVKNITSGGKGSDLEAVKISNDEVGVLTKNIFTLVDTINNLSTKINSEGAILSIKEINNFIEKTELHATEAEAANKAKSDFLSIMSHEIRTPLSAILGITEIQLQNPHHTNELRESLEKIFLSGDMLLSIINDILDLSKIETGKLEFLLNEYEVASMISDTIQLNIIRMGSKPIKFDVWVDENIPAYLIGDELRVKQILNNILSNAFKYTDEGSVKMYVSYEKNAVVVKIGDSGQGMTAEQVKNLFDKYTRFNLVSNREVEGAGLGMSIVKNLVDMMKGDVYVKSEPEKGTEVTVHIPQKPVSNQIVGKETAENLSKFKSTGQVKRIQVEWEYMPYGKVLVVDDLDANLYVAKGFLAPYGLSVETVESGLEAIEKIKSGNIYDVIFMDHMMPKMDGVEATKKIREMGYNLPIIAFTANAIVGREEEFSKNGFDGFMSKPIQSGHLGEILNKFIKDKQPPEVIEEARKSAKESAQVPEKFNTNKVSFDKLCKDFAKSQKTTMSDMQNAINNEDFKAAHILAHTLKSYSGYIGEKELTELAIKAESALRESKRCDRVIESLNAEMERVLKKINRRYKNQTETLNPTPDDDIIIEIFNRLEPLLQQSDADAIFMVNDLVSIPDTVDIINHIESFNFDLALECLERLRREYDGR